MTELKRGLGYWTVLSLSIGSILGTTIFFGAGIGAKYAGNLTIIAWIVLSVVSIYIAMCFGELVSMFPQTGGVYEYSKRAYGRFVSFMTGWTIWLVGNLSVAVMIVAAINALLPESGKYAKLGIGIGIIAILNIIAFLGIEATSILAVGFALAILSVIIALIGKGVFALNIEYIIPALPLEAAPILISIFFLAESFFGWEGATYLAEETRDARKTIPRAILHGTIIIAVLGLAMMVISFGILGTEGLLEESAVKTMANRLFPGGSGFIIIGIFIALLGSAASGVITMPRLLLALARDKLFLEQLKAIHPRFNTPHKAILFQTIITVLMLFMAIGSYDTLLSLFVPLATLMYIIVILTVPILRFKNPEIERTNKAPYGKVLPIAVVMFLFAIIIAWAATVTGAFTLLKLSISIILIGVPLYFLVGLYHDPRMITDVNDLFSYFSVATESLNYPKGLRHDIMSFLGDIKGKAVLEFGCGVGTLTTSLLRAVGPDGKVIAVHFSKNDLKIASKRIEQVKWQTEEYIYGDARLIHDPDQFFRLHPDIVRAQVIVSVGMLAYMQDVKNVLKDMSQILSQDGRVCFVEYSDFFHILPSIEWLSSDKKIEEFFREAGFSVRVTRRRTFLWNRIFIYGFRHKGMIVI